MEYNVIMSFLSLPLLSTSHPVLFLKTLFFTHPPPTPFYPTPLLLQDVLVPRLLAAGRLESLKNTLPELMLLFHPLQKLLFWATVDSMLLVSA